MDKRTSMFNVLWTGREYYSLENCLINTGADGNRISSRIVGSYHSLIYNVGYEIYTDANWQTLFVQIERQILGKSDTFKYERSKNGVWVGNGKECPEFRHCVDVDIPLTPFTNTLPIRRLKMQEGETKLINVIYFDMLEDSIKAVTQRYTCKGPHKYHYENVPNDFEADIEVDGNGLVVDYPELFKRSAFVQM
jgi:uncharacterized protein